MDNISHCKKCHRLVEHLKNTKKHYSNYLCQPVPSFGDDNGQLLIIGLAPGLHGANATGRPFTGDNSGDLLFQMLFQFGFSSLSVSKSIDDNLVLSNCKIINAVRCLPPNNKPISEEITQCNSYLKKEMSEHKDVRVILCLGQIAHKALLKAKALKLKDYPFSHHAIHQLDKNMVLIDSYHCGRYNTQTKRLTTEKFEAVFTSIKKNL